MKKPKAASYDLMSMKTGDRDGATDVLAVLSADQLDTIARIAKALAGDHSGVLLKTVKSHMDFWEAGKMPKAHQSRPAKRANHPGKQRTASPKKERR